MSEDNVKFWNADGTEWIPPKEPFIDNYVHIENCKCLLMGDENIKTSPLAEQVTCPLCKIAQEKA